METGDTKGACHEASKAKGGIFRGVFLEISGFVSLVDNNEPEIVDWGEKGRARTNDDLGFA